MSGYWFAKHERARNKINPVSREGWLVIGAFVGVMFLGAFVFALLVAVEQFEVAIGAFVALASVAGVSFVATALKTCDPVNTVEDYRRGRVAQPPTSLEGSVG